MNVKKKKNQLSCLGIMGVRCSYCLHALIFKLKLCAVLGLLALPKSWVVSVSGSLFIGLPWGASFVPLSIPFLLLCNPPVLTLMYFPFLPFDHTVPVIRNYRSVVYCISVVY